MLRLLPKVLAVTLMIALAPVGAAWTLRATGVVGSPLLAAALGAALSLAVCQLAARAWERRADAGDVLFGDLLLWGWSRRWFQERRLASAVATVGLRRAFRGSDPLTLSVERRAELLGRLAGRLEAGDPYTHGHSRRVARYASMIAKRMGVSRAELARIRTAAAVHDVGKLEIPPAVLHKRTPLTDDEFELIKRHAADGASMVSILEDDQLTAIVRHHHERLDGSGYPDRLSGAEIPLGSRVIAVADTFDAITSARPYRAARPHRAALAILRAEAGTQLDRDAVEAFCSVYSGRRGLSALVALTDGGERLLAWIAGGAVSAPARLAAIAVGTAAVGTGAVALPAAAQRTAAKPQPKVATVAPSPVAAGRARAAAVVAAPVRFAPSATRRALGQAARTSAPPRSGGSHLPPAPTTGGAPAAGGSGTATATTAAAAAGSGTSAPPAGPIAGGAPSAPAVGASVPAAGTNVTVGGGQASAPPAASVQLGGSGGQVASVQAGGAGPVTAGATVGGTQSTPPGVTVSPGAGGHGAAATVNVPGLVSIKVGLG